MNTYTMTKIVATLGPATNTYEMIKSLVHAGVTMFRINSSHDTVMVQEQKIDIIRKIAKEENILIPILLDLQGPKIRVGELENSISLKKGQKIRFQHASKMVDNIVPVDYEGIAKDVKLNEKILVDDGKIQFTVTEINGNVITAEVLTDGILLQRKGINIPGSTGSINVLTQRDLQFVDLAVKKEIDYLGLSFVRDANDVLQLREKLKTANSDIRIISKIEKPQAVVNIDKIIEVSDGIMVARGDLGIEISTEQVPIVQKTIIKKANLKRKVVIVATQMLESMIENPIPTRAETSDVANAIIDGTDAVMLSGETAMGKYPVEAVTIMNKIAKDINESPFMKKNEFPNKLITKSNAIPKSIAISVSDILKNLPKVKGVIAMTATGYTPALISECRPSVPIYALCPSFKICRFIQLYNSVFAMNIPEEEIKIDKETVLSLNVFLKKELRMRKDDNAIVTGSIPHLMSGESTNFLKIHNVS